MFLRTTNTTFIIPTDNGKFDPEDDDYISKEAYGGGCGLNNLQNTVVNRRPIAIWNIRKFKADY
jgi:hypothetical protein